MNFVFVFNDDENFIPNDSNYIINYHNSKNMRFKFWDNGFIPINWYNSASIDLLYISMSVFAADRLCTRRTSLDGWSRELKLYIPVIEKDIWDKNKGLLEETLRYLSGDNWTIEFRKREESKKEKRAKAKWKKDREKAKTYSSVCMFSGGLDSFIGAIDLLQTKKHNENVLFVSHYGGGKGTIEYQKELIDEFIDEYKIHKEDFRQFHSSIVNGVEDTTRTRSFMFFAHAIALASTFGKEVVLTIPENGLISLNIPSTYSRLGTSSTRTTHPFYMGKLQELIKSIGLSVKLKNPYQFKTKGEMILECRNQTFMIKNIKKTMSCSHPDVGRHRGEKHTMHCGYCLPCVIRQAAIKRAGIIDESQYYDSCCQSGPEAKINLNSYRLGLLKYEPKYAFMTIQQNGAITEDIDGYTDLYRRGMEELREYIEGIK
ncbi:MAG: Qat anti-phage system QueC-like protein QatC [Candidatus Coproplasma sp.]